MAIPARLRPLIVLAIGLLLCGCGSKISEANYYRVHYGMTEDEVDDVLGPAHEEHDTTSESPAPSESPTSGPASRPTGRKIKSWSRGSLLIRVEFENGQVVSRSLAQTTDDRTTSRPAP